MEQQTAPIKLNGPGDLAAVVPHLLGFAPESSLVVVGLNENGLQCTFRVDLPERAEHANHVPDLVAQLMRNNCGQGVTIVFGPEPIAAAVASVTDRRLDAAGIVVLGSLRVDQGRYWSLTCDGPCCPPEGRPVPKMTEAVLALIAEGAVARSSREAVAAMLDAADPEARKAVRAAVEGLVADEDELDRAAQRSRRFHVIDRCLAADAFPGTGDLAALGLALGDLDVRDYALRQLNTGRYDQYRLDMWIWVVRHMEDELVAPAATVTGFAAYRSGNGVLALEAFELALQADPHYRLARMLLAALQAGIPPAALAGIGASSEDQTADRA
jgi:hypothetical protein